MAEQQHPFKAGDVVHLRSGGPRMTVVSLSDTVYANKQWRAICKWWSNNKYEQDDFSFEELAKIDGADEMPLAGQPRQNY